MTHTYTPEELKETVQLNLGTDLGTLVRLEKAVWAAIPASKDKECLQDLYKMLKDALTTIETMRAKESK